jgi:streptomycin 6-kinase
VRPVLPVWQAGVVPTADHPARGVPAAEVPPLLARNVAAAWGEEGRRWLSTLPDLIAAVARDWDLLLGPTYPMSFHWVVEVRRSDGVQAVLKLGPPHSGHLDLEAASLARYDGHGAVRLMAHDLARGALLLERASPGTATNVLVPGKDLVATAAIITVLRRLHTAEVDPALPGLLERDRPSFVDHLRRYPGDHPIPRRLVVRAAGLLEELSASATQRVLLHGDLHHDNVLRAEREPWLAIDPHGVVGDPGFDVAAMLYNPDPERRDPELVALVPARIEQLADGLGMPIDRVVAWGFVMAVLSEVWTAEGDGLPVTRALDVALALEPRLS